jgi:uroporphyrinogen-III synthase
VSEAGPLAGRTVVTTRELRGLLDAQLERLGARVLHVPLIATEDAADGGAALETALAEEFDWVVVTSPSGAERVGAALRERGCRIGAVGTRTAEVVGALSGRPPAVVPDRQTAADLAAALPPARPGERLLLAQADRADPANVARLAARGYAVTAVTAYRTVLRRPTADDRRAMLAADAVAFASGSAVKAWAEALGSAVPPVVAVIGPSTAAVAADAGIKVSVVAADHSIDGLTAAIVGALTEDS